MALLSPVLRALLPWQDQIALQTEMRLAVRRISVENKNNLQNTEFMFEYLKKQRYFGIISEISIFCDIRTSF